MKAKFSPLELLRFDLLQSNFSFKIPKEDEIDLRELFQSYPVEIDFAHHPQEDDTIHVQVIIEVNNGKRPKEGYSFVVEGYGVFRINNEDGLEEDLIKNLRMYSTTNMMINNLRNIMYQTSNLGPMDGYQLPPIDILDLFRKKEKAEKKQEKE